MIVPGFLLGRVGASRKIIHRVGCGQTRELRRERRCSVALSRIQKNIHIRRILYELTCSDFPIGFYALFDSILEIELTVYSIIERGYLGKAGVFVCPLPTK